MTFTATSNKLLPWSIAGEVRAGMKTSEMRNGSAYVLHHISVGKQSEIHLGRLQK